MTRIDRASLLMRGAAVVITCAFALLCLYGAFGPWQWGHNGFNGAAFCQAARNAIRFGIPGQALYYTGLERPGPELIYTHHPQLLHWHLVVLFKLLGYAPWVGRMVPVFYSVATLVLIHRIGVQLWDRATALIAMTLYAFTPLHSIFANMIDHEQGAIFFLLLTVYHYVRWLESYAKWRFAVIVVCISLGAQFDWPAYYIAFFLALHAFVRAIRARRWCPEWTFVIVFSIVVLVNFGGFFLWIRSIRGTLEEMGKAYTQRTGAMNGYALQLYRRMLDMHGPVILWATALWVPLVIGRARRRALVTRDLIPACFFGAQIIHSSVFRHAGFIHSYWTYYLGVATAFGGAEVITTLATSLLRKRRELAVFAVATFAFAGVVHLVVRAVLKLRWAYADGTGSYIVPYPDQGPEIRFAQWLGATFARTDTVYGVHPSLNVRIEFHWYHDTPFENRVDMFRNDGDVHRGKRVVMLVDISKTGARSSIARMLRSHPTWLFDRRFLAVDITASGRDVHAFETETLPAPLLHRWFVDPLHAPARYVPVDAAAAFAALDFVDLPFESETAVRGGVRWEWDCPAGEYLGSLEAAETDDGSMLARIRGTCRKPTGEDGALTAAWGGRTSAKPTIMRCADGSAAIGVHGRNGKFIDALGLICAPIINGRLDSDTQTVLGPVGGAGGSPIRLVCPYNMVVRGLRVRAGALIDSVGIGCGNL
jgi:hypothetical protein